MLKESFIFLPGIQAKTESRLWQEGIHTWDHLLEAKNTQLTSGERLLFWKARIRQAQQLLERSGVAPFSRLLGARNTWRLFPHCMDNPRFVDIETTEYRTDVTVVGVSDGEFYQGFVKGRNLDTANVRRALSDASCIITFNGSSFDLPIIEHALPGALPSDVPHLDMRHICAQAGLHGGLKRIERHMRVQRADGVREIDGADAIMLWYRYRLGDEKALQELIDYNAADVLNLAPLVQKVVPALWQQVRHGTALPFAGLPRAMNVSR